MIGDDELRNKAGGVREAVKEMLIDKKRNSVDPNQEILSMEVLKPLAELQKEISAELSRIGDGDEKLVPIDRDPVPDAFTELVQKYYETLGKGE